MTDREALLACYLSGQMSAAQWERHCEDDPELRTMAEAKTSTVNRAYCIPGHLPLDGEIDRRLTKRLRTLVSGDSPSDLPPSLAVKPNLDWSEQTIEQLEAERVYWDERVRTAPGFASANAAVEFRDACDTWINRKRSKGGDANAPALSRADDASPGVKTGATDPIAAMREALKEIDERRYRRLFSDHPWLLSDFGNAYSCGSQQAHEECSDIARAALAAYDAAGHSAPIDAVEQTRADGYAMTDEQIKYMVDRFLGWKLPENFRPDAGISFKPAYNEHTSHPMRHEPSGANLFDAEQAEAMVRYIIDGLPSLASSRQSADVEEMARTIADIWGPAGERREYLYSDLLSFAARADYMAKCARAGEERTRAAFGKRGEG